jgi:hypothetical protein
MASRLDTALLAALTRRWDEAAITSYTQEIGKRQDIIPAYVTEAFQQIDMKATGLLTHVSMMIAGLGICIPILAKSHFQEMILMGEIAVYLLIALGCIRCLSLFEHKVVGDGAAIATTLNHELILRHELYRVCNRVSIVFTLIVFFGLPVLVFWLPDR